MFGDIKKWDKRKPKVELIDQKEQQDQKTISSVTSLCGRRLTAPNITAQLNPCHEKNESPSTMWRRLCEAGLYGRTAVKNTTVEEVKQCQKVPVGLSAQRQDNRVVE